MAASSSGAVGSPRNAAATASAAGTGGGAAAAASLAVPPDELVAAWLQMVELRTLTLSSALQRLLALGKAVICDPRAADAIRGGVPQQAPADRLREGVARVLSQLRSVELLPTPRGAAEARTGQGELASAADFDEAALPTEDRDDVANMASARNGSVASVRDGESGRKGELTSNLIAAAELLARMRVETGRSANDLCAELGLPLGLIAGNPRALMDLLQAEQRAHAAALAVQAALAILAEAADSSCWVGSGATAPTAALARLRLASVQTALLSADQAVRSVDSPISKILEVTPIA